MLVIKNATIITPAGTIPGGNVVIEGGRIKAVGPAAETPVPFGMKSLEASGLIVAPGFLELQLNGAFGSDFTRTPERIWDVGGKLARYGVTSFLPTILSTSPKHIRNAQNALEDRPAGDFTGAFPLGLHIEGPYLNPGKKGAHNPKYLRPPTVGEVADWSPENGIRMVTIAPELGGALATIEALTQRGVIVAAGHSLAGYEETRSGIEAGIRYATHIFNAMPAIHHREPGLVGALLSDERVVVGLIADGIHVHSALVKILWQLLRDGRLNLVTDAMAALGKEPGTYRLGDLTVTVTGDTARLADGTLAGSVLSLDKALRNLLDYTGCGLAEAIRTVTSTPATVIGLGDRKGQIAPGFDADLVLLTSDFQVEATLIDGSIAYRRE